MEYKFYKVTSGKFIERLKEIGNQRKIAIDKLNSLCDEVGAESASEYNGGGLACFNFAKTPDKSIWKPCSTGWMPKLSTKEGKLIAKKVKDLGKIPSQQMALDVFDLVGYRVFGDNTASGIEVGRAVFCGHMKYETFFIKVPQDKESPYIPTCDSMVECKELEMLKFMDEVRS
jgi:hypothetical protein